MAFQSIGKNLRLRRILSDGRAVVVAMDHGNAAGPVRGLERPARVVRQIARSGADAILVTPGVLRQVSDDLEDLAVVLRIDGCASPQGSGQMHLFVDVEQAVAMGADAVVMNATLGAGFEGEELKKVGAVASEAERWGMPVVAEILSNAMMANHMDMAGTGSDQLPPGIGDDISLACRMGAELGSDVIKTRYSGDVEEFRHSVDGCGVPVLVAGGPRREGGLEGTLQTVREILDAGASGVIFGRQIWQHSDPAEAAAAVASLVHSDRGRRSSAEGRGSEPSA